MADTRINALSTATSSVSDDFVPIDGTTNGTRKLSAYSPSFGGNATVGGTLTVSGTGDSAVSGNLTIPADKGFYLKQGNVAKWTSDGSSTGTSRGDIYCDSGGAMFIRTGGTSTAISISSSQVVSVAGTLASTSTSSGALVVGNGTSGGLGVGGAIFAGGVIESVSGSDRAQLNPGNYLWHYRSGADAKLRLTRAGVRDWDFNGGTSLNIVADSTTVLTITSAGNTTVGGTLTATRLITSTDTSQANDTSQAFFQAIAGNDATLGGLVVTVGARPSATGANRYAFIGAGDNGAMRSLSLNDNGSGAYGQVLVRSSTASNNTSSGALVVSGGVGVAGAIYAGGGLAVTGGSAAAGSIFKTSTLGLVMSGATGSSYDLFVTNPAGNYIMQVPTGTRNVEFAATLTTIGNITSGAAIATSAPVGGSGSWELGVYSTTAPAATGYVTIEIGGVAYKLLASNV